MNSMLQKSLILLLTLIQGNSGVAVSTPPETNKSADLAGPSVPQKHFQTDCVLLPKEPLMQSFHLKTQSPATREIWVAMVVGSKMLGVTQKRPVLLRTHASLTLQEQVKHLLVQLNVQTQLNHSKSTSARKEQLLLQPHLSKSNQLQLLEVQWKPDSMSMLIS